MKSSYIGTCSANRRALEWMQSRNSRATKQVKLYDMCPRLPLVHYRPYYLSIKRAEKTGWLCMIHEIYICPRVIFSRRIE